MNKRLIIAGVILVALVITAVIVIFAPPEKLSQKDKEAKIAQVLGRKPILEDNTPKGNTIFKGKYAYFPYPASAKVYTYKDPGFKDNTSVLETFSFDLISPKLVFNYSVVDRSNISAIEEIPDVKLREMPQNGYLKEDIEVAGIKGLLFKKGGDSAEQTAFFYTDNKEYSISIAGSSAKEVDKLYRLVMVGLKFTP